MGKTENTLHAMLAHHTGVPASEIFLESRLVDDLGIDSHIAAKLFEEYEATFDVDVEDIWQHWNEYFGTEGVTLQRVLALVGICIVVDLPLLLIPRVPAWTILPTDICILAFWLIFSRRKISSTTAREITVKDLLVAIPEKRLRLHKENAS